MKESFSTLKGRVDVMEDDANASSSRDQALANPAWQDQAPQNTRRSTAGQGDPDGHDDDERHRYQVPTFQHGSEPTCSYCNVTWDGSHHTWDDWNSCLAHVFDDPEQESSPIRDNGALARKNCATFQIP